MTLVILGFTFVFLLFCSTNVNGGNGDQKVRRRTTTTKTTTKDAGVYEGEAYEQLLTTATTSLRRKHLLVRCHGTTQEQIDQCLAEISSTSGSHKAEITNYMENTPFFAIDLLIDDSNTNDENDQENDLLSQPSIDLIELDLDRRILEYDGPVKHDNYYFGARRLGRDQQPKSKDDKKDAHKAINDDVNEANNNGGSGQTQETQYGVTQMNAPSAWDEFKDVVGEDEARGSRAKVCIIDTGLRISHEDLLSPDHLSGNIQRDGLLEWSQDTSGHGTHIAGIIGAADNDLGVVGVAPKANTHVVRVYSGSGSFTTSQFIEALRECEDNDADIINMSFGGPSESTAERDELQRLRDNGVLLFAAAGNTGDDVEPEIYFPGGYDSVVSVGATTEDGGIAFFSSFNEHVNVVAPGVGVYSLGANSDSHYRTRSGTSMSAPHAAGVAALLVSIFPNATANQIVEAMEYSADDLGACGFDPVYGNGKLDALEAAKYLEGNGRRRALGGCKTTVVSIETRAPSTWWVIDNSLQFLYRGTPGTGHEAEFDLPGLSSDGDCFYLAIQDVSGDRIEKSDIILEFDGEDIVAIHDFEGEALVHFQFGCVE